MTVAEVAQAWGATEADVTRWCRLQLLPAVRTPQGWRIAPHARPPWRDGRMLLAWVAAAGSSPSASSSLTSM